MSTDKTTVHSIRLEAGFWAVLEKEAAKINESKSPEKLTRLGKAGRYTVQDLIRDAIDDKLKHLERSRKRRKASRK